MGQVTESQQIEAENEEAALGYLEVALRALPDPRRRQGKRYPLRTVVVVALMAMVCGCDDAEAMELWARPMRSGCPSFWRCHMAAQARMCF
jgi:hypothetical protein